MKRYRVWQANREIFLFPENWMEPEFRLDKTDLFQALEATCSRATSRRISSRARFRTYLKGLELRARLDIVATYLDQDLTNPGESTLYTLAALTELRASISSARIRAAHGMDGRRCRSISKATIWCSSSGAGA